MKAQVQKMGDFFRIKKFKQYLHDRKYESSKMSKPIFSFEGTEHQNKFRARKKHKYIRTRFIMKLSHEDWTITSSLSTSTGRAITTHRIKNAWLFHITPLGKFYCHHCNSKHHWTMQTVTITEGKWNDTLVSKELEITELMIKINIYLMSAVRAENHCYLIPKDTHLECILMFPFWNDKNITESLL